MNLQLSHKQNLQPVTFMHIAHSLSLVCVCVWVPLWATPEVDVTVVGRVDKCAYLLMHTLAHNLMYCILCVKGCRHVQHSDSCTQINYLTLPHILQSFMLITWNRWTLKQEICRLAFAARCPRLFLCWVISVFCIFERQTTGMCFLLMSPCSDTPRGIWSV